MSWHAVDRPPRRPTWVATSDGTEVFITPTAGMIADISFTVDHERRRNYFTVRMDKVEHEFGTSAEAKQFVEATYELQNTQD